MLVRMENLSPDLPLRTPEDHEVHDLLIEQAKAGLSLAAFARERGLSNWKLYRAKRKSSPPWRPTFEPVTILPDLRDPAPFELELGGGLLLRIPPDFDEVVLRRLVEVLVAC